MVEDVVSVSPQLEADLLAELEHLHERHVKLVLERTTDVGIASHIAERLTRVSGRTDPRALLNSVLVRREFYQLQPG